MRSLNRFTLILILYLSLENSVEEIIKKSTSINYNNNETVEISEGKSSLVFVFDTTGSMHDDLEQLRQGAEMILSTAMEESKVIGDFVFVPFHDPVVGPATVTKDKEVFKSALDVIKVYGGGDCPEKSLGGIQLALSVSQPHSFVYVFTDATAGDHRLIGKVLDSVQRKQSQIIFVLTGHCNDLNKPSYQVYQQIAAASSGQIFNLNKTNVHKVLDFVRSSIKGKSVNLGSIVNPPGYNKTQGIPIDSNLGEVTVSVSGSKPKISVLNPKGELTVPPKLVTTLDLSEIMIVKVLQPEPGNWTITTGSEANYSVRVVGLSNLTFSHGFSVVKPKNFDETSYRPLFGAYNYMVISLTQIDRPVNIKFAEILSLNGKTLFEIPLKKMEAPTNMYITGPFIPPEELFYIAIHGVDEYNQDLRRVGATAVQAKEPDVPYLTVLKSLVAQLHDRVTLRCGVESLVPINGMWSKDGMRIQSQISSLQSTTFEYLIEDMNEGSSGTYRCVASNVAGESIAYTEVVLLVSPPHITIEPKNTTVQLGQNVTIICSVTSEALLHKFEMVFNGTRRQYAVDLEVEPNISGYYVYNKTISYMSDRDSGTYTCVARNRGGVTTVSTNITIQSLPTVQIVGPHTIATPIHTDIQFVCHVENADRITWVDPNCTIVYDRNVNGSVNDMFEIKNVEEDGVWSCIASMDSYRVTDTVTIELLIKPKVTIEGPKSLTIVNGTIHEINCIVTAKPTPRIIWHKETEVFLNNTVTVLQPNVYKSVLTLNESEHLLNRTYFCIGENFLGIDEDSVSVNIRREMILIKGFTDKVTELYDQAEFQCQIDSYPPAIIKWLHNGTALLQSDRIHIAEDVLVIRRVDFSDLGSYACEGTNGHESLKVEGVLSVELETPLLLKTPQRIVTRQGDQVIITCSIIKAKPKPKLIWQYYNTILNESLTNLPNHARISEDEYEIIIPKVETQHSGTYRCLAKNIMGEDSYEVTLIVEYAPQLVVNSTDIDKQVELKAGQNVKFSCKSTGFPPPMVIWVKDQRPITYTAHMYFTDELDLVIEKATEYDSGLYTCNVTSILGSVQRNFTLIVYVPPIITPPGIEPELEILEGQLVELPCSANGVPKPEINWTQNGQVIQEARKYIDDFGLRFVANLTDFGNYTCEAKNKYGNSSYTFSLYIWVAPYIEPPLQTSQNAVIGSNVTLTCDAIGFPMPTIYWKFENEMLEENYTDVRLNYIGNLFIYNASAHHEGLYECLADNLAGTSAKSIYLNVNEPPTILQDNYTGSYIATDRDNSLVISCKTTGKPKPFVAWLKDDVYLNKDSRFDIDIDGTLTIKSPSEELGGFYTCIAKNYIAQASRTAEVTIYSLPNQIQSEESFTTVKILENTHATVKCPIPTSTSEIVKWYKDAKLQSTGELKISNLKVENTTTYVCKVTNLAGSASATVLVDVEAQPSWLIDGEQAIEIVKGDDLYFDCRVRAKPAAKTKWYFNSKPLLGVDNDCLKIMNVKMYQTGVYKCVVSNVHGTLVKEFNLTVLEPPFISEFDLLDVELKEGMNATLECNARGTPAPNITWTFTHTNWYLQNTSLATKNLTTSSEGLYRCDAVNKAGSAHLVYQISVVQSARVDEVIVFRGSSGVGETVEMIVEVVLGSHVRLACKAKGKPSPSIQWIRSGNVLGETKGNLYADLVIDTVQTSDSGVYTCVVSNDSGFDERRIKIDVLEPPRIFKEVFQNSKSAENLTKIEVISGLPFYLHCHPNGYPLPDIYWFKNDLPLKFYDDSIVSKAFGEIIVVEKAKEEHAGSYKCVARNKIGETSVMYSVDVLVPPPKPKEKVKSVNTRFGRQLNLTCPVEGTPAPYVSWIKHPYTEIDQNNPKITLLSDNFTLIINKTEIIDSGKYSCIMTNKVGTSEVIFDVTVDKSPSIAGHIGDNVVETHVVPLRRSVVLKCQVDGNPSPSINWLKDTQQMSDSLSNIHRVLGSSIVAVWSATPKDGGLYICVAQNRAGVTQARYHVAVQVPGKWSSWSQWSYCNVTCGLGHQYRTRYCQYIDDDNVIYDKNTKSDSIVLDESSCKGLNTDKRKCHMPPCEEDTSQMRWSVWSKWSPCSVTCGVGTQTRTRRCKSETPCNGDNVQIRKCPDLPPCDYGTSNNKRNDEIDLIDVDPYSPEETFENRPEYSNRNYHTMEEEENTRYMKYPSKLYNVNVTGNLGSYKNGPCGPGLKHNVNTDSCEDIDECLIESNHCHSTQICINTLGAYSCTCQTGFVSLGVGQRCLDINECIQDIHGCEFACVNVAGGYVCACPPNMRLHADRHHCFTPMYNAQLKLSSTEDANTESYLSTTIDLPIRYVKRTRN